MMKLRTKELTVCIKRHTVLGGNIIHIIMIFLHTVIQNAKSHSEIRFDVVWLLYNIFA